MSTMTAVSQRYPQSVMHCFHYFGAKTLNISHWGWGFHFQQLFQTASRLKWGTMPEKTKQTNKNPYSIVLI